MEITKKIIETHGLKIEEFEKIKQLLKREPNLFRVKIVKSSLGVKAAKIGVLL